MNAGSDREAHGGPVAGNHIDRLEYRPGKALTGPDDRGEDSDHDNSLVGRGFFERVVEGVYEDDWAIKQREILRYLSFFWAIVVW